MNGQPHFAFFVHDLARQFRQRFDARARGLGVTRQQWRVLLNLARHEGPTQADLAETLEVERITLCRMIDRLEEAKLVERRADPRDRRVWRLYLMPGADELVTTLAAIGAELEREALATLSEAEQTTLRAMLGRVRDSLRGIDDGQNRAVA